jgi:hypothetical protein
MNTEPSDESESTAGPVGGSVLDPHTPQALFLGLLGFVAASLLVVWVVMQPISSFSVLFLVLAFPAVLAVWASFSFLRAPVRMEFTSDAVVLELRWGARAVPWGQLQPRPRSLGRFGGFLFQRSPPPRPTEDVYLLSRAQMVALLGRMELRGTRVKPTIFTRR